MSGRFDQRRLSPSQPPPPQPAAFGLEIAQVFFDGAPYREMTERLNGLGLAPETLRRALSHEHAFAEKVILSYFRWRAAHEKPIVLWDVDMTLGDFTDNRFVEWGIRPVAPILFTFLRQEFHTVRNGILSSRPIKGKANGIREALELSGCLAQVSAHFDRSLLLSSAALASSEKSLSALTAACAAQGQRVDWVGMESRAKFHQFWRLKEKGHAVHGIDDIPVAQMYGENGLYIDSSLTPILEVCGK